MYQITSDVGRRRVNLVMSGGFSPEENESFGNEIRAAAMRVKGGGAHFDMLVDLSASTVMQREVATASQELLAWFVANGLRRSANVTGSALLKMQLKRVSANDRYRMFETREEAVAWLESPV